MDENEYFDLADKYIDDLMSEIGKKKTCPKTGKMLSYRGEPTGIYYVTFKAYHAFHRIRGNRMEIGRVLLAKSDYIKVLFGTSEYILEDQGRD